MLTKEGHWSKGTKYVFFAIVYGGWIYMNVVSSATAVEWAASFWFVLVFTVAFFLLARVLHWLGVFSYQYVEKPMKEAEKEYQARLPKDVSEDWESPEDSQYDKIEPLDIDTFLKEHRN